MNIFAISDLHLFHSNLLRGQKIGIRPFDTLEEMHERIVEGWNGVVRAGDEVYMLGDLTLQRFKKDKPENWDHNAAIYDKVKTIMYRLNGFKRLLLGNHDRWSLVQYYQLGFDKVLATWELDKFLLSHYPVHPGQFSRYTGNVHGHTHETDVQREYSFLDDDGAFTTIVDKDRRYLNVSCERVNYTPMSLEDIRLEFKNRGVM